MVDHETEILLLFIWESYKEFYCELLMEIYDIILASKIGVKSVELLMKGETNLAVGIKDGKIHHMDISDALSATHSYDRDLFRLTEILSL